MSGDIADMKALLAIVASGQTLSEAEAAKAFDIIMSGDATPAQMGGFLMALRVRGESIGEIAAAAQIMRDKALIIEAPENAVDTVGTTLPLRASGAMRTGSPIGTVRAVETVRARSPTLAFGALQTRIERDVVVP